MPNKITSLAAKFKQRHIQKRKSYAVLTLLALVVVIGTVGVLVRPASTLSGELVCGLEEHRHTEECYERTLICGQEESEEHTHTEACWQTELICQVPEHTHMDECYATVSENENQLEDETADQQEDSEKEPSADEPEKSEEAQNNETPAGAIEKLPASVPADYTDLRETKIPEGGRVRVYARPGTLPENVAVKAQLLSEESGEYAQAIQRLQTAGVTYDFVTALDISLYNKQGEKVEPNAPVYVEIEAGSLLSRDADPASVQIQHHKEILSSAQQGKLSEEEGRSELHQNTGPKVVLETVIGREKGLLTQNTEDGSFTATFPVDSFSTYTITSEGWTELKIKVRCVDEVGDDIPIAPKDVVLDKNHVSGASFGVDFASGENRHPKIEGYRFDNKAYYMEDGHYVKRIYGIRRENSTWYYFPRDYTGAPDLSSKVAFNPQPDFYGENPKNTVRLVYKKVSEIPVEYLEWMSYTALPAADAPGGENPSSVRATGHSLDISNLDAWPKSNTYFFTGRAYVGERNPANEIASVIAKDGKLYAVTAEVKEIELTKDNPLRLLYAKTQTEKIPTIPTVSTRDKGLTINLFDYNTGVNTDAGVTCGPNDGINANKDLQFVKDSSRTQEYNRWTGQDGGIYTEIVQDQLDANGYPVMQGGQSLDYLFDPKICEAQLGETVKHLHTDLDHLFWQDRDGYYRYDSMTNFATIMDETADGDGGNKPGHIHGGNFVVYAQPALPGSSATGDNPKFLPFNKYVEANRPNLEHNKETIKQYHFGMTMEAEFLMPPGGEVVDADGNHVGLRDMIFEFNGDDDVWVFIDGKLALDLGGIHDRYGGTINFRTGEVRTNAPPMEHSGLRQENLYGIPAEKEGKLTPEEIAPYRDKAGFGSYTKHTFKFFYLERGRGASNCEIRFNLVPVTHRLVVGKRLPTENGYGDLVNMSRHQS